MQDVLSTLSVLLLIGAAISGTLATFRVPTTRIDLGWACLTLLVCALLVGHVHVS